MFQTILAVIVQFQKKSIPTHGRSLEIPRERGVIKVKIIEANISKKPFLGGGGGSMDIFLNCILAHGETMFENTAF